MKSSYPPLFRSSVHSESHCPGHYPSYKIVPVFQVMFTMKQMFLQTFLSGYAVAQSVTSGADGTAVASSSASITTSLELTVDGKPSQSSSCSQNLITIVRLVGHRGWSCLQRQYHHHSHGHRGSLELAGPAAFPCFVQFPSGTTDTRGHGECILELPQEFHAGCGRCRVPSGRGCKRRRSRAERLGQVDARAWLYSREPDWRYY